MKDLSKEKTLLLHAISPVLKSCGNSYANAYTQSFLEGCKELGVYKGSCVGSINELSEEFELYLESIGGLPEFKYAKSYCKDLERENKALKDLMYSFLDESKDVRRKFGI